MGIIWGDFVGSLRSGSRLRISSFGRMAAPDFFTFFSEYFGDRWPGLLNALRGNVAYETIRYEDKEPYYLDEASAFAARALDIEPGMDVLDMCAAPGGKTLVLAEKLRGEGSLQSNDRSSDRLSRLSHVIENSLPEKWRASVRVSGYDGTRFGRFRTAAFDRILLDAPCSSERHLLEGEKYLGEWSPKRISHIAIAQGALLASAVDALKPGGHLVYSTCALTRMENDDVIRKILKKRKGQVQILEIEPKIPGTEKTEFGLQMLPDRCNGRGPIFCAKLEKLETP